MNSKNIFARAAKRKEVVSNSTQVQTTEVLPKKQIEIQELSSNIEELKAVISKHIFINKWYQGPSLDRMNENFFIKDDKMIIIEDDEDALKQERLEDKSELLPGLVTQHIQPTNYIMGDKEEILEKMRAEEVRQNKMKKENETKKFIKNSDVKMTIYPAYDNFFKKQF